MPDTVLRSFRERALRVIEVAFGGEHHVDKIKWQLDPQQPQYDHCTFTRYGGISSWDFDEITRLVVAGHDECVRIAVMPNRPKYIKIMLSNRARTGRDTMAQTCPTLEAHVAAIRGSREQWRAFVETLREPEVGAVETKGAADA